MQSEQGAGGYHTNVRDREESKGSVTVLDCPLSDEWLSSQHDAVIAEMTVGSALLGAL